MGWGLQGPEGACNPVDFVIFVIKSLTNILQMKSIKIMLLSIYAFFNPLATLLMEMQFCLASSGTKDVNYIKL